MSHVTDLSGSEDRAKALFDQGLQAYHGGQLDEALRHFLDLEKIRSHASEVLLNIGNVYFQKGELDDAKRYFQKAISLEPLEANAYLNLGNLYFKQKQYAQAAFQWEQYRQLVRNNAAVYLNLGLAYDQLGQPDKALRSYSLYLGQEPKSPEAGQLYSRFENARRVYENNIKVAETALASGELKKSRDIFVSQLALYPGSVKTYKTVGNLLYKLNELEEALKYYIKAHELRIEKEAGPDPGVLVNMGVAYEKLGRRVDALWAYALASRLSSADQGKVRARRDALLAELEKSKMADLQTYIDETRTLLQQPWRAEEGKRQASRLGALVESVSALTSLAPLNELDHLKETADEVLDPNVRAAKTYFNRAEDARSQGRLDQALTFYEKYIGVRPTGEKSTQARQRIAEIKQMLGAVINSLLSTE